MEVDFPLCSDLPATKCLWIDRSLGCPKWLELRRRPRPFPREFVVSESSSLNLLVRRATKSVRISSKSLGTIPHLIHMTQMRVAQGEVEPVVGEAPSQVVGTSLLRRMLLLPAARRVACVPPPHGKLSRTCLVGVPTLQVQSGW
jgi:hypothetical protein